MSKLKVNELDTESGTTITVTTGKTVSVPAGATLDVAGTQTVTGTANLSAATLTLPATLPVTALTNATAVPAAQLSGQVPLANLDNAPATDTTGLQNDIATLALHSATQNNQAAYNLSNAFVDQYEDSTGIDTTSTVSRDSTGEFMASGSEQAGGAAFVNDSNTQLLYHFDGADGSTTFTDDSGNGLTGVVYGDAQMDTAVKKMGTASYEAAGTNPYIVSGASALLQSTGDFTVEFWFNSTYATHSDFLDFNHGSNGLYMDWHALATDRISTVFGGDVAASTRYFDCANAEDGNWHHFALVRDSSTSWYFYYDGVSISPVSGGMTHDLTKQINPPALGIRISTNPAATGTMYGHKDEFRFSNVVRYPGGTTFIPNAGVVTAASGNYTSTTEVASATVSKMGIVVLYKNASGTATLDTDLVAQVSADGGANYVSAPLTSGGTFSTGVLIAKSNDVTISNTGTAPKYKISFANQVAASKVTEVHGAALLY